MYFSLIAVVVYCALSQSDNHPLAERFQSLTRDTRWTPVRDIALQFDAHHPQGMTIIGDRYYVSSVEVINRAEGQGRGHVFEIAQDGALVRAVALGEGPAYHPGGIDFDGERIWVAVAEYRPDSSSIVYALDLESLAAEKIFTFNDHLGAFVHDRAGNQLVGVSWGSRRIYRWPLESTPEGPRPVDAAHPTMTPNPSHYIDYQDMQVIPGTSLILCGGLARIRDPRTGDSIALGGIDLLDAQTLRQLHQLPIPLWSPSGRPYTQNPFYVRVHDDALRFFFLPEDGRGTIYVIDARH